MSKWDKGIMGDNSSKTMLDAVDEQLNMLAGLIVGFRPCLPEWQSLSL